MKCWLVALLAAFTSSAAALTLHVAPHGNDDHPGTAAHPLATLECARLRVLQLKDGNQPIEVHFAAGTYLFDAPVHFKTADSSTANAPIVYRAAPGAEVRYSSGQTVSAWQAVSDSAVVQRLPPAARPHVLIADLRAQGIDDYGQLSVRGAGSYSSDRTIEPNSSSTTNP